MRLDLILLGLLAPLPYLIAGLAVVGPGQGALLAPAIGCALVGYLAELLMMAGLPVSAGTGVVVALLLPVAWWRWKSDGRELGSVARLLGLLYAFTAFAASLSPFPTLGAWSGDGYILFAMGRAVLEGTLAPGALLSRPPLFGAATAPLWLIGSGFVPYQCMSMVASLSAAAATFALLQKIRPQASWKLLLPLLLSPFFLHHNAAAWGKFLSAALVIGALLNVLEDRLVLAALCLGLATATHDSAVIFVPVLLGVYAARRPSAKSIVRALILMGVGGVLIAGPIQAWEIAKFGLAAKVAANPVVSDQIAMPWALKTFLGVVSSFVAWDPVVCIARWASKPHPFSGEVLRKEPFWLLASWVTSLTGTIVGGLFPLFRRRAWETFKALPRRWSWVALLAIPLFASNALTAFYSDQGTAQAGLVPLQLGLYAALAACLPEDEEQLSRALRFACGLTVLLGTLPWLVLNVPVIVGLRLSPAFARVFAAGSEGDYGRLMNGHLESLGLAGFPLFPLVAGLATLFLWFRGREQGARKVVRSLATPRTVASDPPA